MKKTLTVIALLTSTLFSYAQKRINANISIGNTAILAGEGNSKSYINPLIKGSLMAKINLKTQIGVEVSNNWLKTEYAKVTVKRKYVSFGIKAQTNLSERIELVLGGGYMLNYDTQKTYIKSNIAGTNVNLYYANTGISIELLKDKKITPVLELLPIAYIGKSSVSLGVQTSLGIYF